MLLKSPPMSINSCKPRGVGLIEVLVALVVIGVGMLGIASLYVITFQAKTTAQARMQAINLADDMADRIRANAHVSDPTVYQVAKTATAQSTPTNTCVVDSTTAPSSQCTADQMATYDVYLWGKQVISTLPGFKDMQISVTAATATTPPFYTIALDWTEPSTGATYSHSLQVQVSNTTT